MLNGEEVVKKLPKDKWNNLLLTTNQIRKLLSGVISINNKVEVLNAEGKIKDGILPKDIINDIKYLKIRHLYQAGRHKDVKIFEEIAKVSNRLDEIGNSEKKFKDFSMFIEEIVAYHRFNGGK